MSEERIGWSRLTSLNLSAHRNSMELKNDKPEERKGWNTLANLHQTAKLARRDEKSVEKIESKKTWDIMAMANFKPLASLAKEVARNTERTVTLGPVEFDP